MRLNLVAIRVGPSFSFFVYTVISDFSQQIRTCSHLTCLVHILRLPRVLTLSTLKIVWMVTLLENINYCNLNYSWGILDGGWSLSAVQRHDGMNMHQ